MIIPVRCFTCGKVVADRWIEFEEGVSSGVLPEEVLDKLNYRRTCCRTMFLTHVDLVSKVIQFKKMEDEAGGSRTDYISDGEDEPGSRQDYISEEEDVEMELFGN
jgi:DNA-directed RNA polymerase subunit N